MAGVDVGTAYLTVIPSAKGFAGKLQADLGGSMAAAGSKAGVGFGNSMGAGLKSTLKKVAGPLLAIFAVKAISDFASSSIGAFKSVSGAATGLQRAVGGTVEDASRLNFAAKQSGVSTESFARSMKLLAKNIGDAGGKAAPGAKALAAIGVAGQDAHGKTKPIAELLPQIAEKFKALPNGADKSALAMKLFGRAGLDMLPLLNKGKDGITELMKESDKFGLTIGTSQAAEVKKAAVAQRQWQAALEGVKVQIGVGLLPLLTTFVGFFRTALMPAILSTTVRVRGFFAEMKNGTGAGGQFVTVLKSIGSVVQTVAQHGTAVKVVISAVVAGIVAWKVATVAMNVVNAIGLVLLKAQTVGTLEFAIVSKVVAGATKVWTAAQWLMNAALTANPIGIVIAVIAALVVGIIIAYKKSETFRNIVKGAFEAISAAARFMWNNVVAPVIRFLIGAFVKVTEFYAALLRGLSKIPGFGWAKGAADKLQAVANKANSIRDAIHNIPDHKTISIGIVQTGRITLPGGAKVNVGQRATGGPVAAGRPYIVGEHEPELFVPKQSGTIYNQRQLAGMGGGKTDLSESSLQRLAAILSGVSVRATVSPAAFDASLGMAL